MIQKIVLSSLAVIASLGVSTAAFAVDPPAPITVNGGQVEFSGEITNGACAVDTQDQTVQMGQVRAANLKTAGSTSASHGFKIVLKNCSTDVYKNIAIAFNGAHTSDGLLVLNDNGDAATNVGIAVYDAQGNKVTFDDTPDASVTFHKGTNYIPFTAKYVSTKGGATAGTANATTNFDITYS
ncbi:fimbrial protein [Photobacterium leiognathi]|uniref:fimbrial protein n=1 Tax=Photobacterium leiognathi TaxID=553611 RepID=UPI002980FFC7|nr:fimbrial protein [Photobacterium leiognathi]